MNRTSRILAASAGLVAAGALFGGLAALVAFLIGLGITGGEGAGLARENDAVLIVGFLGAVFGSVLLPTAAWGMLRRVPLGLVVLGTLAGTILGGVIAWLLPLHPNILGRAVLAALGGFLAACLILRLRYPPAGIAT